MASNGRLTAPRRADRHTSCGRVRGAADRAELWHRFDGAVAELNRVAAGTDLLEVADVYEALAEIAAQLAQAVEREDRASGLLLRTRARRSA
jgi:hypothetical protein